MRSGFSSLGASCSLPEGAVCRAVPDPSLQGPPFVSPYTSPDIPLDYKQQLANGTAPEQVAVFPASRNGSHVFVRYILPRGATQHAAAPAVSWGPSPETSRVAQPVQSSSYTFGSYQSGQINFVLVGPLAPETVYFYRIQGLPTLFNFTSLPGPGASKLHLALIGDVGQTFNSTSTLRNVLRSSASLVLFAGDLTYADRYGPPCDNPPAHGDVRGVEGIVLDTGTEWSEGSASGAAGQRREQGPERTQDGAGRAVGQERVCGVGGLRWDSWGRMSQDTFSHKLAAFVPGNHELEFESSWGELTPFKAYRARTPPLLKGPLSKEVAAKLPNGGFPDDPPLFYSLDVGPAHIIGLSSYSPFVTYSHQSYWLIDNICSVNRTLTPWLIVFMHVPWYNSNIGHYREGETMRQELEEVLHEAGVDLVVSGHTHAYERSFPVHRLQRQEDGCGAVHITMGDGGNIEEIDGPFLEPQPSYSAFRREAFGHAELVINGSDSATFLWYQNKDGDQVVGDRHELRNQARACSRRRPTFC